MITKRVQSPCRLLVAFAALSATAATACQDQHATLVSQENQTMTQPPQASRPSAPEVEPIEHNGVRYVQDEVQSSDGDQNGGYLAAIDPESGEKLWRLKVYEVAGAGDEGLPNFGIYFQSMRLVPGSDELEIEDETGGRYRVDLNARTSTVLYTPGQDSEPAAPPKPKPEPPE